MKVGEVACHLGIGLVAGLVGTAAITITQLIEMRIRGRNASNTPAKAVEKTFGIQPVDEAAETRLSTLTHWGYGTSWGTFRSLLGIAGLHGPLATSLHAIAIQGTAMVMLPSLQVAPPVREWGAKAIGIDMLHHLAYGAAAGLTYDWLCQNAFGQRQGRFNWNLVLGGLTAVGLRQFGGPAAMGLRQLGEILGLSRPAPSRMDRARRIANEAMRRDWPKARQELAALRH